MYTKFISSKFSFQFQFFSFNSLYHCCIFSTCAMRSIFVVLLSYLSPLSCSRWCLDESRHFFLPYLCVWRFPLILHYYQWCQPQVTFDVWPGHIVSSVCSCSLNISLIISMLRFLALPCLTFLFFLIDYKVLLISYTGILVYFLFLLKGFFSFLRHLLFYSHLFAIQENGLIKKLC